MKAENSHLGVHIAGVGLVEDLLAKYTRAGQFLLLRNLSTLQHGAHHHLMVMESVMSMKLLASIHPGTTDHTGMSKVCTNLRLLLQLTPVAFTDYLCQYWPPGLRSNMELICRNSISR